MIKPDSAKGAASLHTFALSQELIMSEFSGIFDFVRNTTLKAFIRPSKDSKKIIEKAVRQYINSNPELFSGVTRQQLLYGSEVGPSLAQIIEVARWAPLEFHTRSRELQVIGNEKIQRRRKENESGYRRCICPYLTSQIYRVRSG